MKKVYLLKLTFVLFLLIFYQYQGNAQAPSGFTISTIPSVSTTRSNVPGFGNNFPTTNTYTLNFATNGSGLNSPAPVIASFTMPAGISEGVYNPIPRADGRPFTRIKLNRVVNPLISNTNKFTG